MISNQQKVFPLPKVALEAHAFGHLKGRDDTSLDPQARRYAR
jgi:hypothetical protein